MRQIIRSYHVFLCQVPERFFIYLVYPVLVILPECKFVEWGVPVYLRELCCASLVLVIELVADFMAFGGIASKDTNKLEYLKTSVKGIGVLRNGIVMDAIRRTGSVGTMLLVTYGMDTQDMRLTQVIAGIFATLICIELGLMLTRSFALITFIYFAMAFIGFGAMYVIGAVLAMPISVWQCSVLVLAYMAIAAIGRMMIMKRAKGSYYDGRD